MSDNLAKIGIGLPNILIPKKDTDLSKWAVVACDQYSSQPEYWQKVEETIGESESAYHLILPEVYLGKDGEEEKIKSINESMKKYVNEGILEEQEPGFIYIDRKTSHAASRKGLIVALDLERYDYNKGSQTLIRATEGTDVQRLPPRVRIRENALLELPHIMVLIDDPKRTVIEPIARNCDRLEPVYDVDLMLDGGHIKGYKVADGEIINSVVEALYKLADSAEFASKYNVGEDKGVLLFAVGDGNHSLASAKAHWENVKKELAEDEVKNHPARYALVEIVNVHDEGLSFEPIHRVVFNISIDSFVEKITEFYKDSSRTNVEFFETEEALFGFIKSGSADRGVHLIPFKTKDRYGAIIVDNPGCNLVVGTLQCFFDKLIKDESNVKIDYIHGKDVVDSLASKEGNIGFYLPDMDKCDLFKTVILDGALPKKTFSMGEAEEKRFYMECRRIRND